MSAAFKRTEGSVLLYDHNTIRQGNRTTRSTLEPSSHAGSLDFVLPGSDLDSRFDNMVAGLLTKEAVGTRI